MIKKFIVAGIAGLALAGCQTKTDWGALATGTGIILASSGATASVDPVVAKASAQIERYCPLLQIASAVATETLTDKARAASLQATAALKVVCYAPPADAAAALIVAERAYEAARAAKIVPPS